MPKTRELVHDRAARNDLIEIWTYTLNTWGEVQADHYLELVASAIRSLTSEPERGRGRDELRKGYRSVQVEHHVVFYTVSQNEVRIRRVLHEAMDLPRHL